MLRRFRLSSLAVALAICSSLAKETHAQEAPTPSPAPATTETPAPTEANSEAQPESEDPSLAPIEIVDAPAATPAPGKAATAGTPAAAATPGTDGQMAPAVGGGNAEQAGKGKGSKGAYSRPLLFAPEDNKIEFANPQIKWDMQDGKKINLGGLIFEAASIRMTLDQVKRDDVPSRFRSHGRGTTAVTNLSFQWPSLMSRIGLLTIEDRSGQVLWSTEIDEAKRSDWISQLKTDGAKLLKAHYKNAWGILDVDTEKVAFAKHGAQFRFCLAKSNSEAEKIKICSNLHTMNRSGEKLKLEPAIENKEPTVFIGKDAVGTRATVNFPAGRKIELKVVFGNGSWINLSSRPLEVKFLDIVASKNSENIILTGRGPKPLGKVKDLEVPPNHFWSATGVEKETVWRLEIDRDLPILRVLGAWNLPFAYLIRYQELPREEDRIYINTRTGSGTYVSDPSIRVLAPSGAKVLSKETKTKHLSGKNEYLWTFRAKDAGRSNKARLMIEEPNGDERKWVAHYQLYRGYPWEFSARLTGIVAATLETVLIGEVATSRWFERLANSESYYLSEKRWGATARYFKALQAFVFQVDAADLTEFSVANFDVKYNLIPGIWNRDELFGLIFSAEMVNIAGMKANLGGVGAYWARTMPRIFDDIFNWIPFFRYPKYVDMELIYYPLAISSDIEPGSSFNLNFHGKVFWSPRIYGEAGFGLKRFHYIQKTKLSDIAVGTAFGTVGLGIIF